MKRLSALVIAFVMALVFTGCAAAEPEMAAGAEAGFELHVINVGKADCLLIKSDGLYMMVDTGEADDEKVIREYLDGMGIDRLETLVATHPDKDHIGGVPWVVRQYEVGEAWLCPLEADGKPYLRMMAELTAEGTPILRPMAGHTARLGGASIEVYSPTDALLATESENECSIVLMVAYGDTRFLLMGDAQDDAEAWLLASGYELNADVLKVGHHGSKKATSPMLIAAVAPEYAAISCGYSEEGAYPSKKTLETLSAAGVRTLRTDIDGTIVFRSDGKEIALKCTGADPAEQGYIMDARDGVFHLTICPDLPKRKQRVFFARREDAIAAGGKPCPICRP